MESHLLQMRGLKLYARFLYHYGITSHLLQMRGLKLIEASCDSLELTVASFTDAWIETYR